MPLERLTGHAGRILWPDFSADGKTLYTPSLDGTILQYDLGGARRFGSPFKLGVAGFRAQTLDAAPLLAVAPDGRSFAATVAQSSVTLFSTSTLRRMRRSRWRAAERSARVHGLGDASFSGAAAGSCRFGTSPERNRNRSPPYRIVEPGPVALDRDGAGGRVVAAVDGWDGPATTGGGRHPAKASLQSGATAGSSAASR